MFIMWFSGLRGAIGYALALHLEFEEEHKRVVVTTTLIIVLFTIVVLGGFTMPVMKIMNADKHHPSKRGKRRRSKTRSITLSKTKEMGTAIESDHLSDLTEEEYEVNFLRTNLTGFVKFDIRYLMPLFTRRFTEQVSGVARRREIVSNVWIDVFRRIQEVKDCKSQMTDLTNRWYQAVRRPSDSEDESEGLGEILPHFTTT